LPVVAIDVDAKFHCFTLQLNPEYILKKVAFARIGTPASNAPAENCC